MQITKGTKIGVLVTGSLILFFWGFNFLKGNDLLKDERHYYAMYERVDGLVKASPVIVNGYKVGQVRSVRFLPDNSGRLLVHFVIETKFQIHQKTVAQIYSTDIMGTKAIRLLIGTEKEFHPDGDTLASAIESDIKDEIGKQLAPIKSKAENLIVTFDSVMLALHQSFDQKSRSDLRSVFENMSLLAENLEKVTASVNNFVAAEKLKLARTTTNMEEISQNLKASGQNITKAASNFAAISDSLAKSRLKSTIDAANLALVKTNKILGKVEKGEGSLGLLVNNDSLYNNLKIASQSLDLLLKDMKQNPKRYVHFSALDFGKKVYTTTETENKKK
jgi:phospholipid/cholesterol/gamma-HCH transport system substrate-binding protein